VAPVECSAGTYAINTSTVCSDCDAGYKCPSAGLGEQIPCPTGYYQTSTGQTSCTQCGQGMYIYSLFESHPYITT
jgi:hypothetical protein